MSSDTASGSTTVEVTDGKLTIAGASGSYVNTLGYIEIEHVGDLPDPVHERQALGDERIVVDEKQSRLLHAPIIGEGRWVKLVECLSFFRAESSPIPPVVDDNLIEVESVSFAYARRPILKGVSMRVPRGSAIGSRNQ